MPQMPGKPRATAPPNPGLRLLALVNHPTVQAELKLTDDQKTKLKDLASKRPAAGARKPGSSSGKPAAGSNSPKTKAGPNAQPAATVSPLQAQIDDLLDADQRKRLAQIALQVEGPLAVGRPDVAKKINLSAAQVKKVQAIAAETRNQIAQLGPIKPPPIDQPEPGGEQVQKNQSAEQPTLEQIQQDASTRVTEVLKPAQKEAFDQLLGPAFDVAKIRNEPLSADALSGKARSKGKSKPRGTPRKP
jgi:hypothetical protein